MTPQKYGVAITTHNRSAELLVCLAKVKENSPADFEIVIIDDATANRSLTEDNFEFLGADQYYYFENNVGIAAAKNKCVELLMNAGCDHIFLFDDDTYPIKSDWWRPYAESPEPHLAYIFADFAKGKKLNDTFEVYRDAQHVAYTHQRGCMLYYARSAIEQVGGMDWDFGRWGFEHPNLADRIFNSGLTTFRYMDVLGSAELIYSGDEHEAVETTCGGAERQAMIRRNAVLYATKRDSTQYIPYDRSDTIAPHNYDLVLTSYFTGQPDPERKLTWEASAALLAPLLDSVAEHPGIRVVVITDCLDEPDSAQVQYVRVPPIAISPYFARWVYARQYLARNPDVGRVWCVDATDVEMVNNPFEQMDSGEVYTGDEPTNLLNPWMLSRHPADFIQQFIVDNVTATLLNAGLLGGSRNSILRFLSHVVGIWEDNQRDIKLLGRASVGDSDMGVFNFVARKHFSHVLRHGRRVNTIFKQYQNTSGCLSWWKHK